MPALSSPALGERRHQPTALGHTLDEFELSTRDKAQAQRLPDRGSALDVPQAVVNRYLRLHTSGHLGQEQ